MVSIKGRIPMKRIDRGAHCPSCRAGGDDIGSREGVKGIHYGGDDNGLVFECDSCEWESRAYEYVGPKLTPLSLLYNEAVSVGFDARGVVFLNDTPLSEHSDYAFTRPTVR